MFFREQTQEEKMQEKTIDNTENFSTSVKTKYKYLVNKGETN